MADQAHAVDKLAPSPDALAASAARGRPHVTLKAACSLDGRTATAGGESQWITGPEARAHVMRLRAAHTAICAGIGTVLADDPALTVRPAPDASPAPGAPQPTRVMLDSTARTPLDARVLTADGARRIVLCGNGAPAARVAALRGMGVEVWCANTPRPDPDAFLPWLFEAGVRSLLVEGGGMVAGSFIARGAVDALFLYMAPIVLGGGGAPGWSGAFTAPTLPEAPGFEFAPPIRLGRDLLLQGTPVTPAPGRRT